MKFLVEMAPPGLGNLCQVLHSGGHLLRTDLSEFQGQNFKVGTWGHTGGRISLFLHSLEPYTAIQPGDSNAVILVILLIYIMLSLFTDLKLVSNIGRSTLYEDLNLEITEFCITCY